MLWFKYTVHVHFSGNHLHDKHASRNICKLSPIFKSKLLWTHDICTINPYFHVDFCEHDTHTILSTSVGLTQACPNQSTTTNLFIQLRYIQCTLVSSFILHCLPFFLTGEWKGEKSLKKCQWIVWIILITSR